MNIYKIYTYTDPERGWGYGDPVTFVEAESRENAVKVTEERLGVGDGFWWDHGILELTPDLVEYTIESIRNKANLYARLKEEISRAVERVEDL